MLIKKAPSWYNNGSEYQTRVNQDILLLDSQKATFGTGGDADIYYDATDLVIAPAVAGAGDVVITGGRLEVNDDEGVAFGTGKDATISYDGTNLVIEPQVVGSGNVVIDDPAILLVNDTANGNQTVGLTLNQGANDDDIITFKSSDVSHPMTGLAEADTYGRIRKAQGGSGGMDIKAFKDAGGIAAIALYLNGVLGEAADTTDTSSSRAIIEVRGQVTNGSTSSTSVADAGNLFAVWNAGALFLVKGDGTLHATNVTSGSGDLDGVGLDAYDDVGLVRAFQRQRVQDMGIAIGKWDEYIQGNRDDLIKLGVLSSDGHFVILQRMNDLLGGAIWQTHQRLMELHEKVAELENKGLRSGVKKLWSRLVTTTPKALEA